MIKQETLSAMQMRKMTDVFEQLRAHPYIVRGIERYGECEGVLVSNLLWQTLEALLQGHASMVHVALEHAPAVDGKTPTKLVVVTPLNPQEWELLIDWIPYSMKGAKPDYEQLVWRHHPDVAKRIADEYTEAQI